MEHDKDIYTITQFGKETLFFLPRPSDHIQNEIITSKSYYEHRLLNTLRHITSSGQHFLDVGANIGNHSLFSAINCGMQVTAIEPWPENFNILKRNIEINKLIDRVHPFNCAAGNKNGKAHIQLPNDTNLGHAIIADSGLEIDLIKLDDLLNSKPPVDIVKIDVEGAELDVLKGLKETITKDKPIIFIESQTREALRETQALLEPLGFTSLAKFNATPTYLFCHTSDTGWVSNALQMARQDEIKHEIIQVSHRLEEQKEYINNLTAGTDQRLDNTFQELQKNLLSANTKISSIQSHLKNTLGYKIKKNPQVIRAKAVTSLFKQNPSHAISLTKEKLLSRFKKNHNPIKTHSHTNTPKRRPLSPSPVVDTLNSLSSINIDNLKTSIIMPTWNRENVIEKAIDSVKKQTHGNWELIVVDDGSTDNTEQLLENLVSNDKRITYLKLSHEGVSAARNMGAQQATGNYVAYLDSDNTWHPQYLEVMLKTICQKESSTVYCGIDAINTENNSSDIKLFDFNRQTLLQNNYIDINAFMHTRSLLGELGSFDTELKRWVDWDLIIRFTEQQPPAIAKTVLVNYYTDKSLKRITENETDAFKFKVLNKHLADWSSNRKLISKKISIVIPVYNKAELTDACLKSIGENTSGDYEIIIVDNGSSDNTRHIVKNWVEKDTRIKYISNYENYGYSLGNNIGVSKASGEYLILLNNDTIVTKKWADALISELSDPNIGACSPMLLYPDNTTQCVGLVFSEKSNVPYHIYQNASRTEAHVNKKRAFQALTGACLAMRTSDYIDLGGLDPIFINGSEDIDFCLRIQKRLQKKLMYIPESVVYHYESKTEGRGKNILYNRNTLINRWSDKIVSDDIEFYNEDGFTVERYEKKGAEEDGPNALYKPVLRKI